jgi:hypothetical protein
MNSLGTTSASTMCPCVSTVLDRSRTISDSWTAEQACCWGYYITEACNAHGEWSSNAHKILFRTVRSTQSLSAGNVGRKTREIRELMSKE